MADETQEDSDEKGPDYVQNVKDNYEFGERMRQDRPRSKTLETKNQGQSENNEGRGGTVGGPAPRKFPDDEFKSKEMQEKMEEDLEEDE